MNTQVVLYTDMIGYKKPLPKADGRKRTLMLLALDTQNNVAL